MSSAHDLSLLARESAGLADEVALSLPMPVLFDAGQEGRVGGALFLVYREARECPQEGEAMYPPHQVIALTEGGSVQRNGRYPAPRGAAMQLYGLAADIDSATYWTLHDRLHTIFGAVLGAFAHDAPSPAVAEFLQIYARIAKVPLRVHYEAEAAEFFSWARGRRHGTRR